MPSAKDFTTPHYRELLRIAKHHYCFSEFDGIPWGERFVLWRHDCDSSLNRAKALAYIEAQEGVVATYFLNPHSEFYNLLERSQLEQVMEILAMGHKIGLHLDTTFHNMQSEADLEHHIEDDLELFDRFLGVRPKVFSFHNPTAKHFAWDADSYGGLVNCYSARFKSQVSYCSDSNGYWRFSRLQDVLASPDTPRLQVLTHPEWWQEVFMPPRQRIFRCAYGRAASVMQSYDGILATFGRTNLSGDLDANRVAGPCNHEFAILIDYLWNQGHLAMLFLELWRFHESQINEACAAFVSREWQVDIFEAKLFFRDPALSTPTISLFQEVVGASWASVTGMADGVLEELKAIRYQLIVGRCDESCTLERYCIALGEAIIGLDSWIADRSLKTDLSNDQGQIRNANKDIPDKRWNALKNACL